MAVDRFAYVPCRDHPRYVGIGPVPDSVKQPNDGGKLLPCAACAEIFNAREEAEKKERERLTHERTPDQEALHTRGSHVEELQKALSRDSDLHLPRVQTAREELFALHGALCADALNLMKKKNVDYAEKDDPYENFRLFGRFGILVRMGDKFARLRNYERNGKFSVEDEGLKDTIIDIINYAVLYFGYEERA